jgi:hypothetical protein
MPFCRYLLAATDKQVDEGTGRALSFFMTPIREFWMKLQ